MDGFEVRLWLVVCLRGEDCRERVGVESLEPGRAALGRRGRCESVEDGVCA